MSIRSELIRELEQNRTKPVSGQKLAQRLHVSRNAVCKMIHTLNEEGFEIASFPRKGYQLAETSNKLSAEAISVYLKKKLPVYTFEQVDSTNQLLKKMAIDGSEHLTLIAAEEQRAGRGRFGRPFYSPSRTGIYMSLLLRMPQQLSDASMITIYAAVAVQRALKQLYQTDTQIKWVNDIFYQGKKLCGILCEAISDFESGRLEAIIVGIGLNTSTMTFPEELKDIAVSLSTHPVNRNKLIACIVNELLALQKEEHSSVLAKYRDASVVLHQQISWMQNGKQDMIVPMMYYLHDNFFPFVDNWVDNCNGRLVVPGLGAYRMLKEEADWTVNDITDQIDYSRYYGGAGCTFFRCANILDNTKGIYDELKDKYYKYPAQLPPLSWLDDTVPAAPEEIRVEKEEDELKLSWQKPDSVKDVLTYTVYYSLTDSINPTSARNILMTGIRDTSIYLPVDTTSEQGYIFSVSSSTRYHIESVLSKETYYYLSKYPK